VVNIINKLKVNQLTLFFFIGRLQANGLCDRRKRPCKKVTVLGTGFLNSTNVTCHIEEVEVLQHLQCLSNFESLHSPRAGIILATLQYGANLRFYHKKKIHSIHWIQIHSMLHLGSITSRCSGNEPALESGGNRAYAASLN